MLVYVGINVKKLVLSEGDDLTSEEFLQRHEELEGVHVPWDDLRFIYSPSIKKVRANKYGDPFVYNEESKKYI